MRSLDFVVIGAAKSGTTTLFEIAKNHPELCMPAEKEVPFYDDATVQAKGYNWYIKTYFKDATMSQKIGTITPQYMLGKDTITPKAIAKAIHRDSPNVKLVAILRDPIDRAYSHYQMFQQRGHFTKPFATSAERLLADPNLASYRSSDISDSNTFFLGSEYGRILADYLSVFDRKQLLVLTTEELKVNPGATLQKFLQFIGVDDSYRPENLGEEFRRGGAKARTKLLTPGVIFKLPGLEWAWKHLTPYSLRKKVEYRINLWNIKPGSASVDTSSELYKSLVAFYAPDVKLLSSQFKLKASWLNTYLGSDS